MMNGIFDNREAEAPLSLAIHLAFTRNISAQTMPVGIANFAVLFLIPWSDLTAVSVAVTAPLVAMRMLLQQRVIVGMTAEAVKG